MEAFGGRALLEGFMGLDGSLTLGLTWRALALRGGLWRGVKGFMGLDGGLSLGLTWGPWLALRGGLWQEGLTWRVS